MLRLLLIGFDVTGRLSSPDRGHLVSIGCRATAGSELLRITRNTRDYLHVLYGVELGSNLAAVFTWLAQNQN
jgi:hypothetical protein